MKRDTNLQYDLINAMNLIVLNMNNENAYDLWLWTYPDGADEDDVREMAESNVMFDDVADAFFRVCKAYGKDGLCTLTI